MKQQEPSAEADGSYQMADPNSAGNEYGLRRFMEAVYPNWDNRCATCYALRFEETARYAAEHGYDQFTSTLFVSPYQNHELMRQICEQMAEKYGVKYLHRDFSPRFREGQDKARELGLYMQNYCGCVFSEEDRYRKQIDRDRVKYQET